MRGLGLLLFCLLAASCCYAQYDWKNILTENDFILLGEGNHGIQSYYQKKQSIIAEIEQNSEREVLVLVESPLLLSVLDELRNEKADYHYHHTNTADNIQFLSKYENFGFDIQEDCRYKEFSAYLIEKEYIESQDPDLLKMDSLLSLVIRGEGYQKDLLSTEDLKAFNLAISGIASKVLDHIPDAYERQMIRWCFDNRLYLAEYMHISTEERYRFRMEYRDRMMAENVKRFKALRPDAEIILWAANLHLGRRGIMGKKWTKYGVKSMAEYLDQDFDFFSIAIVNKPIKEEALFDAVELVEKVLVAPEYLLLNCD